MNWTLWRMAWRNLWRHKQRTILMIATVAFGSWVILLLFGITDGFIGSMTISQVTENQGGFQVRAAGYADDPIPENGLSPEQVVAVTDALSGMRFSGIAPRMETVGMVRSAYGTDGVILRGIDPAAETSVTELDELIVAGRYLDGDGQILLSTELAESLDVRVGERVVVLAGGGSGSRAFTAVGLFRSTVIEMERVAVVAIDDVRSMTGLAGVTSLAVGLPSGVSVNPAAARAERLLADRPDVAVADYFDLNPLARVMISGATIKLIPFVVMISLMAGFGVANTAFYSVLERTREFGMMTAVGMSRRLLAGVILLESTLVAAIGFVIGGGIGYGLLLYLGHVGINFGALLKDFGSGFGMPTIIYTSTSGLYWVAAFSVVVFTAIVAAWYPARRVNRLEPVTAIREG